jgi:hypothetical protein
VRRALPINHGCAPAIWQEMAGQHVTDSLKVKVKISITESAVDLSEILIID